MQNKNIRKLFCVVSIFITFFGLSTLYVNAQSTQPSDNPFPPPDFSKNGSDLQEAETPLTPAESAECRAGGTKQLGR